MIGRTWNVGGFTQYLPETAQSSPFTMAGPSLFNRMAGLSADNESLLNQW